MKIDLNKYLTIESSLILKHDGNFIKTVFIMNKRGLILFSIDYEFNGDSEIEAIENCESNTISKFFDALSTPMYKRPYWMNRALRVS